MTLMALIVLTVVASGTTYVLLRCRMNKEIDRLRAELRQERDSASESAHSGENPREHLHPEELDPRVLSALGASVSALVGKEVTISPVHDDAAKNERPYSWAHEGYVAVQHSHDLLTAKRTASPIGPIRGSSSAGNKRNVA